MHHIGPARTRASRCVGPRHVDGAAQPDSPALGGQGLADRRGAARFPGITIDGDAVAARALLRAMVCQLAVLHSPEHVKIAAVVRPETEGEWEWLKWLPHHQHPHAVDGAGPARMVYRSFGKATAGFTFDGDGSPHLAVIVDAGLAAGTEQAGRVGRVTVMEVGASRGDAATAGHLRLHIAGTA